MGGINPGEEQNLNSIFSGISILLSDFSFATCAGWMRLHQSRFPDLELVKERAMEHGVQSGITVWMELGKYGSIPGLELLITELKQLRKLFPDNGTAKEYESAFTTYVVDFSLGDWIRDLEGLAIEPKVHGIMGSVLSAVTSLANSTNTQLSLSGWFQEVYVLVEQGGGQISSAYGTWLEVGEIGEWLPPLSGEDVRLLVGFTEEVDPKPEAGFIAGEGLRKYLGEWVLPNASDREQDLLDWTMNFGDTPAWFALSYPKFNSSGKEQHAAWPTRVLSCLELPWVSFDYRYKTDFTKVREKNCSIGDRSINTFSASQLDHWKRCPFLSLVEREWRQKDLYRDLSMDISPMDEGSIVHQALEIFFARLAFVT